MIIIIILRETNPNPNSCHGCHGTGLGVVASYSEDKEVDVTVCLSLSDPVVSVSVWLNAVFEQVPLIVEARERDLVDHVVVQLLGVEKDFHVVLVSYDLLHYTLLDALSCPATASAVFDVAVHLAPQAYELYWWGLFCGIFGQHPNRQNFGHNTPKPTSNNDKWFRHLNKNGNRWILNLKKFEKFSEVTCAV